MTYVMSLEIIWGVSFSNDYVSYPFMYHKVYNNYIHFDLHLQIFKLTLRLNYYIDIPMYNDVRLRNIRYKKSKT